MGPIFLTMFLSLLVSKPFRWISDHKIHKFSWSHKILHSTGWWWKKPLVIHGPLKGSLDEMGKPPAGFETKGRLFSMVFPCFSHHFRTFRCTKLILSKQNIYSHYTPNIQNCIMSFMDSNRSDSKSKQINKTRDPKRSWLVVEPPISKICSSNWMISPGMGEKIFVFLKPPRESFQILNHSQKIRVWLISSSQHLQKQSCDTKMLGCNHSSYNSLESCPVLYLHM